MPVGVRRRGDPLDQYVEERLQMVGEVVRIGPGSACARVAVDDRELDLRLVGVKIEEELVHLVDDLLDPRVRPVDLVDDEDDRKTRLERLPQHEAGLRERPFARVDEEEHPVDHRQRAFDLAAEVRVTRRVDDVDLDAAVPDGRVLGKDRDSLFALEIHRVEHPVGDVLVLAERPGLPEHRVHERRLPMIDMRHDGHVADVLAKRHPLRVAAVRRAPAAVGVPCCYRVATGWQFRRPVRRASRSSFGCIEVGKSRTRRSRKMPQKSFRELGVSSDIVAVLATRAINEPFPIQALILPDALAGVDVLAKSPTGSGKTLGFVIPIVERIAAGDRRPSALVLVPTRELCAQVTAEFEVLAPTKGLEVAAAYGGVPLGAQARRAKNAHVLVATPGRLQDLADRRLVDLSQVRTFVLDEADRMLDMGFQPQVDRIVNRLPRNRQTMFFSATLDGHVGELARAYTNSASRFDAELAVDEPGEMEHRFVSITTDTKVDT